MPLDRGLFELRDLVVYLPILLALTYGLLILLTYTLRKLYRVPGEEFDAPERLVALIAWPFSGRARQWLREHPERPPRSNP